MDHTDLVVAMRRVDARHDPDEANALLTEAVREIERLRAEPRHTVTVHRRIAPVQSSRRP